MSAATNTTLGEIVLSGDLTGDANAPALRASGVTPGTYAPVKKMYVDGKGRVTSISQATYEDIQAYIPVASATQRGALKVGANLEIVSGVVSVPTATNSVLGAVKIGPGFSVSGGALNVDYSTMIASGSSLGFIKSSSNFVVDVDGTLSISTTGLDATTSTKGLVQIGTGINVSSGSISLPTATAGIKGMVQIGSGLDISGGVVSVKDASASQKGIMQPGSGLEVASGVLSIQTASATQKGLVQIGSGISVASGVISVSGASDATNAAKGIFRGDGVNIITSAGVMTATIPVSNTNTIGTVTIGSGIRISDAVAGTITVDNSIMRPSSVTGANNNTIDNDGSTILYKTFTKAVNHAPASLTLTSDTSTPAAVTIGTRNSQDSSGIFSVPGSTSPIAAGAWKKVLWWPSGNNFIAVGSGSVPQYTSNGVDWYSVSTGSGTSSGGAQWDAAYNNTIFVVVDVNGGVMTLNGSLVPTYYTSGTTTMSSAYSIAWNGTVFCAVGGSGTNMNIATSSDGSTWTSRMNTSGLAFQKVVWNGTVFCASNNNAIWTSPDGITWTQRSTTVGFLAACVGNSGVIVTPTHKSTDNGITWNSHGGLSLQSAPTSFGPDDICFDSVHGIYMMVGNDALNASPFVGKSYYSNDIGSTWNELSIRDGDWKSVSFNGTSLFVAVGYSSGANYPTGTTSTNPNQYRLTATNTLSGSTPQSTWGGANTTALNVTLTLPTCNGGEIIQVVMGGERNLSFSYEVGSQVSYPSGQATWTTNANKKCVLTLIGYKIVNTGKWLAFVDNNI